MIVRKHLTTFVMLLALGVTTLACTGFRMPDADLAPQPDAIEQPDKADTIDVPSAKMGRNIKTIVVLPADYAMPDKADIQYPVVYLLHGYNGDYRSWYDRADLHDITFSNDMIIVCPDGQDSWYFDSPVDPKMQFETFISNELVQYIDTHYRTYRDHGHRAITGLSMGGHGALFIAFRHPDVFGACASMSGGVDITRFPKNWKVAQRLGSYEQNAELWREHSVIGQVKRLTATTAPAILIDDGYDDIFYQVNLNLHEELMQAKIPHDFTVRPGKHSWDYWVSALDFHILFFRHFFEDNSSDE